MPNAIIPAASWNLLPGREPPFNTNFDRELCTASQQNRRADVEAMSGFTPKQQTSVGALRIVGRIAQQAGVKTLVLSHLTPAIDSISDDTWRAPAAKYFKGEIIVGKDLKVV